ncbi:hypothetical protein D3C87_2158960 [compost metagenome]
MFILSIASSDAASSAAACAKAGAGSRIGAASGPCKRMAMAAVASAFDRKDRMDFDP